MIYLNRLMPLEGGLYQWAKLGFSEVVGFMLAWNLWLYVIVNTSEVGLQTATYLGYALGPRAAWMTTNSWFVALATVVLLALMVVVSTIGLSVGKWVHNVGGIMMLVIFGAPAAAARAQPADRPSARVSPAAHQRARVLALQPQHPRQAGVRRARRVRVHGDPRRRNEVARRRRSAARCGSRRRSIAVMFVLGTSTVVAFVPTNDIDLVGPLPQVLRVGFGPFGIASQLVTIVILMTLAIRLAQASVNFTGITRLPMVAGWDRLLPAWFTRLHATYQTPVNSIILVGATSLVIALLSLIGVGQAESFQLLFNAGGMFYAITYVVMFAIPLFGLRALGARPPLWLRVVSLSGLLMTLLYLALSVFPIIKVESVATFALKISAVIVIANVVGAGIYLTAQRRRLVVLTASADG